MTSVARRAWCRWKIAPALLATLMICWPVAQAAIPSRAGSATFMATAPRDTLFTLPVTWVVFDSIRVVRNGELQVEFRDWRLAEPGNRIWLMRPLRGEDTLRVEFVYQPIPLVRTHLRHTLREIARETSPTSEADTQRVAEVTALSEPSADGWSRLNKSGALIRSVQVGTGQDLQLESALNLQVQGRVGRNVDVVAVLTDQSTPIQPEGTTETLSELEKVFVSVRGPHYSTTLGDYTLDLVGGQYDSYSRKLSGIEGQADVAGVSLLGSGAVSRGAFFTNSFTGQESNQGPYPLQGKNGETGFVVLAGSETVWLDGERLRRGEGNDYTIDYSTGQIRFTPRLVITSDSRIVVDFEYATEEYERFYGAGRIESRFGGERLQGAVTYLTESDDRTRPIGLALSEADKAALAKAGDNADSAIVFAADSVGPGNGDYERADTLYDGAAYSMFVFSPRDTALLFTGAWRVLFDDFGLGRGDYEATADARGLTYFYWVGPSRGRYRPFRRVPLPQTHSLADVRVGGQPLQGVTLNGELATSQRDRNSYSSADDANNNGWALAASGRVQRDRPRLLWVRPQQIEIEGRVRHRDERFIEIHRASEIEFERAWGAAANRGSEETIREANVRLDPARFLSLSGGYGDLERPSETSSQRRTANGTLNLFRTWRTSLSHFLLTSDDTRFGSRSNWLRQSAHSSGRVGRVTPRGSVESERRRDHTGAAFNGFRFVDYRGGLGIALPYDLHADGEYRRRLDDQLSRDNAYHAAAKAYTLTTDLAWTPPEGGQTSLHFAHREKQYVAPDSADVQTDVGRFETLIVSRNRLLEVNATYELARTKSQNEVLIAIEVDPGTGTYRREGNQYVPDDQGNYVLVPRFTGTYEPATQIAVTSLIGIRPDELPPAQVGAVVRALSAETEITIEEKTRRALNSRLVFLDPSQFRGDSTLSGSVSLRQDVHFRRLSQRFSLRSRYRLAESLQNQYLNGGQERRLREGTLRARATYAHRLRGETEGSLSRETLRYVSGVFPDRDLDRFELSQRTTTSLSRLWEVGIDVSVMETHDDRTATQASLRELRPRAVLTASSKGRLEADVTWIRASSNKSVIPFELGRGANRGSNYRWTVRGSYQFSRTFTGSLNYSGRNDAGEKTYHTGRLEVRAAF